MQALILDPVSDDDVLKACLRGHLGTQASFATSGSTSDQNVGPRTFVHCENAGRQQAAAESDPKLIEGERESAAPTH